MRPLIAIPARFSGSASALRYAAEVNARALVEAVWRAGGEPVSVHPAAGEVASRLARFDGVLLPGGGDIAPDRYGGTPHEAVYDVDALQDEFDLAVAVETLSSGKPLLAICRGMQVVNVALGGTLHQDAPGHRHVVHPVALTGQLAEITGAGKVEASCYHHQHIDALGAGLRPTARAADNTIEAVELPAGTGWFVAVQWHPEDCAATDPAQQRLFDALVRHA
ncbi:gamma-glutamyl-gamma-aminobutyrate hydrolase family protein [Kibdelosporangium phytohabitans]|uniref:gamma-glutamyl-gamma-aminobutyrate hydrolase family protein n=1 Tax=Kibdelosporangium phytohabitans TaxID=860235 RepID=UPI000A63DD01|nr:gamma-glutamyl-gamma-aminobutyrate hydrolase family protein [Kibdelosporangium phytohabitans]MBE1462871.1 putative glutamine amidotransferase [Kibdelosporangium phytohabitans]